MTQGEGASLPVSTSRAGMIRVTFLGTAGSAPTRRRSGLALLIEQDEAQLLVDCGEGTARQLLLLDRGPEAISGCLLTHLHADHYLGIPGLLGLCNDRERDKAFTIAGPTGVQRLVRPLVACLGPLAFPVRYSEFSGPAVVELASARAIAFPVQHHGRAFGFAFLDGERTSLTISGDTRPCATLVRFAEGADLLIHEATFCEDEAERAVETGHSTAAEAAGVACRANVGSLALVHLSSRHPPAVARAEARIVFPRTELPRDLDRVTVDNGSVTFERGGVLVPT